MPAAVEPARVYTVSGGGAATSGAAGTSFNSSSLPDLLRKSGSSNKRKKRKTALKDEEILSRIELIQDFEFPEASNRLTATRDGQSIVATGTYKPQIRVWDCEQLSLKFERHTDAENVDFLMLSDDWTKSLHLQTDRTVQLQAQGGAHASVRIPRFGRALGYHFPSADAIIAAAGREVYRLNLDQGRFLAPFVLGGGDLGEPTGCNAIDVNPAHGLLCFGTEGTGVVEMWDPRMRKRAGVLSVATETVLDAALLVARRNFPGVIGDADDSTAAKEALSSLSVTALAGAEDGLNLAVGTNTGHVLLYDLRMDRPYQTKDQGFGLPIKKVMWPGDKAAATTGGVGPRTRSEAEGKVLSADAKVIKIWDKDSGDNLVSVTPPSAATDINDVAHYPGTGLLMAAVEGTQMAAWYVPALGPAPRWCSYIDTLTDEMDGVDSSGAGAGKGVYEDFKFIDRAELERLGMSHLIGTQLLRPYMHGYFISLALYERARLLNNPTAYADARERAIKAKLEKQAESRIRAVKNPKLDAGVRVNKELAEKVAREAEAAAKKQAKRDAKAAAAAATTTTTEGDAEEAAAAEPEASASKDKPSTPANLLSDPRFSQLFQDPDFQIDTGSREFAMLNPSTALKQARDGPRKLTAVEDEENESDRESIDPDMESDSSSSPSDDEAGGDSGDSSDEGDLGQYDPRARDASGKRPKNLNQAADLRGSGRRGARSGARLVDDDDDDDDDGSGRKGNKKRSFEDRLRSSESRGGPARRPRASDFMDDGDAPSGARSYTWTPSSGSKRDGDERKTGSGGARKNAGDETFGFGLSKGAGAEEGKGVEGLSDEARFGRQKRRHPNRSASKNVIMRRS
ncbi:related to ENP2 - essential nucleolar protein, required for biogenesis of the small ribosomal subunit [Ustilago trichophora]|uniref:Related to ENP2 - essential nucleolar protein, required for biogenesis of the small ribosomal subunit n=1 Tax=Ustilago trichophora TaxID=86804 RepID=A0A5C3EFN2_9BASI|nr:related to ENP2 - essential nucleolar protein, required for biogenesis of the small ribosomal subunit [Ustilago trichophora]